MVLSLKQMKKKRVGVYLRNDIKYERKLDLEEAGMHIIIVDILLNVKIRLIVLR